MAASVCGTRCYQVTSLTSDVAVLCGLAWPEFPTRVPCESAQKDCAPRVSRKTVPQEWPTRVSYRSVAQESALYKGVPQDCYKSVLQTVSQKGAPQHCAIRD